MSLDLYNLNLITILMSVLLLLLCYQSVRFLIKESLSKSNKFFLISRLVGILIILVLFIHPIIRIYSDDRQPNAISIYVDNSKSMLNNISVDNLDQILINFEKWGLENDYLINWYSVGDSIEELGSINLNLSEEVTNLDKFRNHIIDDSQSSDYFLITDGLNYLGQNQKYNFGKSVNVFGVGQESSGAFPLIERARLFSEDNSKLIHFYVKNAVEDDFYFNLYQEESILSSYSIKLDDIKDGYRLGLISVDSLSLISYDNLQIEFKSEFEENQRINVINDLNMSKPILLISGTPSLNTKYIKSKLMEIGNLEHSYLINNKWSNNLIDDLTRYHLVVFDNYPSFDRELDRFQNLIGILDNTGAPFIMALGPNQNYEIIEKISDFFSFRVTDFDSPIENKIKSSAYYQYDFEDFYPVYTSFGVESESIDSRNIYYDDLNLALSYDRGNMFLFYADIANVAYKDREFNSDSFDDFINYIFTNMYYQDSKVRLFVDKNEFYNNEEIKIKISKNSNIDFEKSHILISDGLKKRKWKLDKDRNYLKRRILEPGTYSIQLIEKGETVSNVLNISIRDYLDESKLSGQDVEFLARIARESGGDYINKNNYLDRIAGFEKKTSSVNREYKYDSKQFLFLLVASIILLSIDWYYRKKNGLL